MVELGERNPEQTLGVGEALVEAPNILQSGTRYRSRSVVPKLSGVLAASRVYSEGDAEFLGISGTLTHRKSTSQNKNYF